MEQLVGCLGRLEQLAQLVGASARPSLLVLQPTPYCNLDCSYCYLRHRDDRSRMSDETLRAVARNILAPLPPGARPTIVWHGGEPMTLPPGWYRDAFALLQRESGDARLDHAFQTNAVAVTEAWIDLWRDWAVSVGVSLDGPADLHDARRRTRAGTGSHALTMRGIARLQRAGLPFHVITVLSAESLTRPDDLYDFYASHGLRNVAFNVEEEEGQPGGSSLRPGADTPRAYRAFLDRFQDRAEADPLPMRCREIEGVHDLLARPHPDRARNGQVRPLDIVSIAADGGMSTFSPELLGMRAPHYNDFIFGNVREGGPETMLGHPAFRRAAAEIARGVAACAAECAYFEVCGGGAPANKYFELGSFEGTETLYCRLTRQETLESVLSAMEARRPDRPAARALP